MVPLGLGLWQELTSEYKAMFEGGQAVRHPKRLSSASKSLKAATSWAKTLAEPSCHGTGLAYSPAHCLFDAGWGSMMFSLSTEPPFDGVLAVSEMSQRKDHRPQPFVQPVASWSGKKRSSRQISCRSLAFSRGL